MGAPCVGLPSHLRRILEQDCERGNVQYLTIEGVGILNDFEQGGLVEIKFENGEVQWFPFRAVTRVPEREPNY